MHKALILCLGLFSALSYHAQAQEVQTPKALQEVWAYINEREPAVYSADLPITDLAWFAADINSRGELSSLPVLPSKKTRPGLRNHLVLAEIESMSLKHFVLRPDLPMREKLLTDLVLAAKPYDGVQVDFEVMATDDKGNFMAFLQELKTRMPGKLISVALPARTTKTREFFDYAEFAAIVDRIVVMAYDEHWSGSKPGPIASPDWGLRVLAYARKTIGDDKLIMGIPFYGRVWADQNHAKAYRFPTLSKLLTSQKVEPDRTKDHIPTFTFTVPITYTGFFEDKQSLIQRIKLYQEKGNIKIGFWQLGQEDQGIWPLLAPLLARAAEENQSVPLASNLDLDKN